MRTRLIVVCIVMICGIVSAEVPKADFTCTPIATESLKISCTDQSTGNPTGWAWFFGDEKYDQPWILINESAELLKRIRFGSVVTPNGNIVVMGGWNGTATVSDVWMSADSGAHWSRMTENAEWGIRESFRSESMPDNSIRLMGGISTSGRMNDTWQSTDYGKSWTIVNDSGGWSGRCDLETTIMPDNSIILTAGQNQSWQYENDTWLSTDGGAHWTLMNPSSEWTQRIGHSLVATPNGNIVLMGGFDNKTWLSVNHGKSWILMNRSSGWSGRLDHTSVTMPDGSIVLMGGSDGQTKKDVWRSTDDGAFWTQVNANPGWLDRAMHTSVAMPDGSIVLMGGLGLFVGNTPDVWRLDPTGSRSQNPLHEYIMPGTYQVTLRAYNANGYSTVRKNVTIRNSGGTQYYININPVPDKSVGNKFTITANTNLPPGQEVLVEIYSPCMNRSQKSKSGEFSGASGTVKVQEGSYNPNCSCAERVNYFSFDVDSSTFRQDIYIINDTAMNIPKLGRSYFYVREGSATTTTTPKSNLVPFIGLGAIAVACGIIHSIRKQKR